MTLSELQQFDEVTLSANSPSELFEYLSSETGERLRD